MYFFLLSPDSSFYGCEMMINIFFCNAYQLGDISWCQWTFFEKIYDVLPDGLFSFIAHG